MSHREERRRGELNGFFFGKVADAMTPGVATLSPEASASDAAGLSIHPDAPLTLAILTMEAARVSRLPVIDAHGRLVGILAREDVIRSATRRLGRPEPATAPAG